MIIKTKPASQNSRPPIANGQIWRMAEVNLLVVKVGKLLVHYQLGKPDAVRVAKSCSSIKEVEKYLKTNKAVLSSAQSEPAMRVLKVGDRPKKKPVRRQA